MEASNGPRKNTLLLMFGLPILQTAIICASMYAGHVLTKRLDRQQAAKAAAKPTAPQISVAATSAPVDARPVVSAPAAPVSVQAPVVDEPRAFAASSVAPISKPVEKAEIASMNRAVEKLAPVPTTKAAEPTARVEKPKAFVRQAQKPVTIPLIRSNEKPAAIPTPLLVPKKDPQKTAAVQIEADEAPARVQLREPRQAPPAPTPAPIQKPVQKTVQLDAPVVPQAAVTPTPTAVVVAPVATAPAKPAPHVIPEPVVVAPTPVETDGDVAVVEPVRRAPVVAPKPVEPAPHPVTVVRPTAPVVPAAPVAAPVESRSMNSDVRSANDVRSNEGRMILASAPMQPAQPTPTAHSNLLLGRQIREDDLSLDLLYTLSTKYVEAYSLKKGLNPADENQRWMKRWMDNVEQAMNDGDNSEQQYINRVTIAKRDCFNIEKASVDKVVEGCRILLRYRDGNFTWLSAMRDALTRENLKKTLMFLNAGPQI